MKKIVNGEEIELTAEEEAAMQAIWDRQPKASAVIAACKHYLEATDWVVSKHGDHILNNTDCDCATKYADILSERQAKRETINSLEN